jgi:hypothetical protein
MTRARNRSKWARPYSWRLIAFRCSERKPPAGAGSRRPPSCENRDTPAAVTLARAGCPWGSLPPSARPDRAGTGRAYCRRAAFGRHRSPAARAGSGRRYCGARLIAGRCPGCSPPAPAALGPAAAVPSGPDRGPRAWPALPGTAWQAVAVERRVLSPERARCLPKHGWASRSRTSGDGFVRWPVRASHADRRVP